MIALACAFNDDERAFKLFKEMKEADIKPRPVAYNNILNIFLRSLQSILQQITQGNYTASPSAHFIAGGKNLNQKSQEILENARRFYEEVMTERDSSLSVAPLFKMLLQIYHEVEDKEKLISLVRQTANQNAVALKDDPDVWFIIRKAAIKIDS